ncbi:MAG: UDP-glucose/GDP-mannose dehydrogenase family protein [Planctomycetota bacterium]|nr:UDP-glucose/GDP-mannose dehydrogenase family protein [Planctomycetota bacterium]
MKLTMIGTGYVGLVTGTCFAESGNDVICVDKIEAKIEALKLGNLPIYEPGLEELVINNFQDGRLQFTTDLDWAVNESELIFIAVGTPQSDDGSADLSGVFAVGEAIARSAHDAKIIIIKSTVPVGTNAELERRVRAISGLPHQFASNPEFLKEGAAIDDFTKPDRVVVGVRHPAVADSLKELYLPFLRTERPFLVMTPESSEMTKYVANCMLATKISFINEMANLCEAYLADINDVRRGIGHDQRIGFSFLFPGVGYGGSCFPKDIRAMIHMAVSKGMHSLMMHAVDNVNEAQKHILPNKILARFGDSIATSTIGVWGLAFKPKTDDIREAPSLVLIDTLLKAGARLKIHDPEALDNVRAHFGNLDCLQYCSHPYEAVEGANALAIVTEWSEYRTPDFKKMMSKMAQPIIFDGRNIFDPVNMQSRGFEYNGIGRFHSS